MLSRAQSVCPYASPRDSGGVVGVTDVRAFSVSHTEEPTLWYNSCLAGLKVIFFGDCTWKRRRDRDHCPVLVFSSLLTSVSSVCPSLISALTKGPSMRKRSRALSGVCVMESVVQGPSYGSGS